MTIDAVGGVWRYAMDLAAALRPLGFEFMFAGLGPQPSEEQRQEASALGPLLWLDLSLDWMVKEERDLAEVGPRIAEVARAEKVDILHLNLPSQAALLDTDLPVVVMSHSCVVTWFAGVRGEEVPADWVWHRGINRRGLDRADLVLAPSRSHAAMLEEAYGTIGNLHVVHNASRTETSRPIKNDFIVAAGRWWDDGKNGRVLDKAAGAITWPVVMAGSNRGPDRQFLPIRHADHRGELAHDEVMALMRRSSIFVSPSLYEPFGLAALEAARVHNALVLADIPTYRELWADAALFADPQDSAAFTAAVNQLIDDTKLRAQMAAKAAERSRRYDLASQAKAMSGLYAGLLRRNSTLSAAE
ncbi:glycosyltransferase [Neorhizobium lilium]|uniref:Glycosyltransferase n=2 Tax=Neorhizobium lilium TaxID=2503024 RepID=A0A444LBZ7_9HYPH|nr:glycosyltransferase [Neorhizobium lilium]